ncbi:MAG: NAD+ synthase [Halolamina sp.]
MSDPPTDLTTTHIDPAEAVATVGSWLDDYLAEAGAEGYVLGVSGGLDSTVAAHLAVEYVGADRLTGIVMPGEPSDPGHMADARRLCADLGIDWYEVDISPFVSWVDDALPVDLGQTDLGNVRARTRMVLWYAEANAADELVIGADNRSEFLLGYFTKYGDAATDVAPLGDLYKTEVVAVARELGVDETFIEKTPTAGLWEGQTDVKEIGTTYDIIDTVLQHLVDHGHSVGETAAATGIDEETVERLADLHRGSEHKRERPPTPGMRL